METYNQFATQRLQLTEQERERMEEVKAFIEQNFRSGRGKTSSYSLKHTIEHEIGKYVSNTQCMICMLECGYKVKDQHGPNLYFGVNTTHEYKEGYKAGKRKDVIPSLSDRSHMFRKGYEEAKQKYNPSPRLLSYIEQKEEQ
jgi:hypothetical protein